LRGGRVRRLWRANLDYWTKRLPNEVWRAKFWLGKLWPATKQALILLIMWLIWGICVASFCWHTALFYWN
jgi:hypothetical protein